MSGALFDQTEQTALGVTALVTPQAVCVCVCGGGHVALLKTESVFFMIVLR